MLTKELQRPQWLEDQRDTKVWRDRAKRFGAFLLAACNPRLEQSAGDDGVAWLNGLRGFAAGVVYCAHHHQFVPHGDMRMTHAFGYNGEYYFGALPGIRFFFIGGGQFAVALFFAISGYVLSYSPLKLMHAPPDGVDLQMATKIGTAFARRWIRLFLPVIGVTFLFMTSWHIFGVRSALLHSAAPTATFPEEVIRWWTEFVDGSYVFHTLNPFGQTNYNPHMWSITVEYRGSLLVYVWVLAMFAMGYSPRQRFWAGLGMFLYFHFAVSNLAGYFYGDFLMGVLICDINLTSELNPSQLPKLFKSQFVRKHTWIYYVLFLLGIYIGSVPHLHLVKELQEEPGWYLLTFFIPSNHRDVTWFFVPFSAALLVMSIPHIRLMKRIFESAPVQYLGKVSFGFYLIHGPIMWTIGDRIYAAVGHPNGGAYERIPDWVNCFPISDKGPLGMEIYNIVPQIVLLPLTLWAAAVVTRLFDMPSVRLSKYLFGQKKREMEKSGGASWELEPMLLQTDAQLPR